MNAFAAPSEVLILHGASGEPDRPDEADTLVQVDAVATALRELGCRTRTRAIALDLGPLVDWTAQPGLVVFNLVESLREAGALLHLPVAVLESLGVPFTGAPALALAVTTDKPLSKQLLQAAGLPTPECWLDTAAATGGQAIVKPCREDASFGIFADSVVPAAEAGRTMAERRQQFGGEWFAERYVEGREFNVSLLASASGAEVLPVAEIRFEGFPANRPRILDYEAKWEPDSIASQTTVRYTLGRDEEPALTAVLAGLAQRSWQLFGLRGYARVDFRVDANGQPWIIEVNANPCLSPDAGFMAAAAAAGLASVDVVRRILTDRVIPLRTDR